jgi:hypothetical protein
VAPDAGFEPEEYRYFKVFLGIFRAKIVILGIFGYI